MSDLLSKFKKLKISKNKQESVKTIVTKIKLKKGTRIKVLGKGDYKGQLGYFDCYVGEYGYCVMDSFPLRKVKIKTDRINIL